jgi:hypothetical protein
VLRLGRRSAASEPGGRGRQGQKSSRTKKLEGKLRAMAVAAIAAAVAVVLSGASAPLFICASARAQNYPVQDYPARTVTLVVPYPPGGGVDAMARVVAEKLTNALGQQVVVDNRAGGSGLVGTRTFIKSAPQGFRAHWSDCVDARGGARSFTTVCSPRQEPHGPSSTDSMLHCARWSRPKPSSGASRRRAAIP